MTDTKDETEQRLVADASEARARVADDVERLAEQLQPVRLKERALNVAENSLASLSRRALQRLAKSPGLAVAYLRERPLALGAVVVVGALVTWRLSRR